MRKSMLNKAGILLVATTMMVGLAGCGKKNDETTATTEIVATVSDATTEEAVHTDSSAVASKDEMVEPESVVTDDMVPISGDKIKDGTYDIEVVSSSSMFKIESCELVVENGEMTATMHMGGTGYLYLYMGTGEEATADTEDKYISFEEQEDGTHTFTVPVESLDSAIDCTAFSKKKEKWYDRQLCFKSASIPTDCFTDGVITTVESLGLEDGEYSVAVKLEGGSGKASVTSPTKIVIEGGKVTAEVIMSSPNYDYMIVNGEKYLPVNESGNSTFEIPVEGFDYAMPIAADTVAMSEPHEIEYTLNFDSSSIEVK